MSCVDQPACTPTSPGARTCPPPAPRSPPESQKASLLRLAPLDESASAPSEPRSSVPLPCRTDKRTSPVPLPRVRPRVCSSAHGGLSVPRRASERALAGSGGPSSAPTLASASHTQVELRAPPASGPPQPTRPSTPSEGWTLGSVFTAPEASASTESLAFSLPVPRSCQHASPILGALACWPYCVPSPRPERNVPFWLWKDRRAQQVPRMGEGPRAQELPGPRRSPPPARGPLPTTLLLACSPPASGL